MYLAEPSNHFTYNFLSKFSLKFSRSKKKVILSVVGANFLARTSKIKI